MPTKSKKIKQMERFLFYLLIIMSCVCSSAKAELQQTIQAKTRVILQNDSLKGLDISLNNLFVIGTISGIKDVVGIKSFKRLTNTFYKEIVILNKSKTQYAVIYLFNFAGLKIRKIAIFYRQPHRGIIKEFPTSFDEFVTSNKIQLGITERNFKKIFKNHKFTIYYQNGYKVYFINHLLKQSNFIVKDTDNEYYGFYFFNKQKLNSFSFGYY